MTDKLFIAVVPMALAWLTLMSGCNREHLGDNYGKQSREIFARQHVYASAAEGSPKGLDSEESALIQNNYKKSLGGQGQSSNNNTNSNVILLQNPTTSAGNVR